MGKRFWMGPYFAEADAGEGGGTGGEGSAAPAGEAQPPETKTPVDIAAGMLAEIEKDYASKGTTNEPEKQGATGDQKGEGGAPAGTGGEAGTGEPRKAAGTGGEGSPLLGADGKPIDPKQQQKSKTAEELALTDEEKKTLSTRAQERFGELIETVKAKDAELAQLRTYSEQVTEARDNIMSLLDEHQVEPQDLTQLMAFNKLVKTGNYDDALRMCEAYRTDLLKALGREAPGYDPLDEHKDLKDRVVALELSREDALEIVRGRRARAAVEESNKQRQTQQQTVQQQEAAKTNALNAIKAWNVTLAADPAYDAKAPAVMGQIKRIVEKYPPEQWLPTLQLLWENTTAPAASVNSTAQSREPQPLRASGAKGGKPEPKSALEALENAIPHSYT